MNTIEKQQRQIALAILQAKKTSKSQSVQNVARKAAGLLRYQGLSLKLVNIQRAYKAIRPSRRQYYLDQARGFK